MRYRVGDKVQHARIVWTPNEFCELCGESAKFVRSAKKSFTHKEILKGVVTKVIDNLHIEGEKIIVSCVFSNGQEFNFCESDNALTFQGVAPDYSKRIGSLIRKCLKKLRF